MRWLSIAVLVGALGLLIPTSAHALSCAPPDWREPPAQTGPEREALVLTVNRTSTPGTWGVEHHARLLLLQPSGLRTIEIHSPLCPDEHDLGRIAGAVYPGDRLVLAPSAEGEILLDHQRSFAWLWRWVI